MLFKCDHKHSEMFSVRNKTIDRNKTLNFYELINREEIQVLNLLNIKNKSDQMEVHFGNSSIKNFLTNNLIFKISTNFNV